MDDLDDFFAQPTGAANNSSTYQKVGKDYPASLSSSDDEIPLPRVKRTDSLTESVEKKEEEGQGRHSHRKGKETRTSQKRHSPEPAAINHDRHDRKSVHKVVINIGGDSDSERSDDNAKTNNKANDHGSKQRTLTKKKKPPPSPKSPPSYSPRSRSPSPPQQQQKQHGKKSEGRSRLKKKSPRASGRGKSHSSSDLNSDNSGADSWEALAPSVCSVEVKTKKKSMSSSRRSPSPEDMTDVSPLTSGQPSPRAASKSKNSSVSFTLPKEDRLQMDLLMRAILEMDREERKQLRDYSAQSLWQKENTGVQSAHKPNFSFPSDRARAMEQENQRLLGKLLGPGHRKQQVAQTGERKEERPLRVTSAAVNRFKDQRRIEQENLAFLRRLQAIKPTRGITRNEQMRDYLQTGVTPLPSAPTPSTRSRTHSQADSASSLGSRTASLFSVRSGAPSESSSKRSRPSSGKELQSRPSSGKELRARPSSGKEQRARPQTGRQTAWSDKWD